MARLCGRRYGKKKGLGVSNRASLPRLLCSYHRPLQKGMAERVALQALTQLHPELSPAASTNFSLVLATGAGVLMLLAPLQATISRQAGKVKKYRVVGRTSIKERELETAASFPQYTPGSWRANVESWSPQERAKYHCKREFVQSFRPVGLLKEGNGVVSAVPKHLVLLNFVIH